MLSEHIQRLKRIERPAQELYFERTYERTQTGLRFLRKSYLWSRTHHETNLLPILKCDIKKTFISAGFSEFGFYGDDFEESLYDIKSEALVAIAKNEGFNSKTEWFLHLLAKEKIIPFF